MRVAYLVNGSRQPSSICETPKVYLGVPARKLAQRQVSNQHQSELKMLTTLVRKKKSAQGGTCGSYKKDYGTSKEESKAADMGSSGATSAGCQYDRAQG